MKKIVFITGNKGKFVEVKDKFTSVGVEVVQKDLGYPEIQADTLEEVASYGVLHLEKQVNEPFILEDAGLFINALNGFPGVYSSYVFFNIGCNGILKLLEDVDDRGAVFKSVFAYKEKGKDPKFFVGECPGVISFVEKGSNGFGYDPIFIPKGESKTFAEMSTSEKNSFSHRGKSLSQILAFFK